MKPTAGDYLAQASLLRLLAVLVLVTAPHLLRMPLWISLSVAAIGLWRAAAALRQWPLPARWLKLVLVIGAFVGVSASYGRVSGQNAGSALLMIMLALKLTEMRSRRDVLVVVSLCYFVMITHFLFSQDLWTIFYLLLSAVAVTAILIEANHAGGPLPPRTTLRLGALMVAHALPLMLALFFLFPRIPGPLWGLPSDAGASRSGLSDSMTPGAISALVQSDATAFRVRFFGPPPRPFHLYWRGPVFELTDGTSWAATFGGDDYFFLQRQRTAHGPFAPAQVTVRGAPVRYEITLEPHRQNWLFALDLPAPAALPADTHLTGYGQLVSRKLVSDRRVYLAESHPEFTLQPELDERGRRAALQLPAARNPRTLALARSWREQGLDGLALVQHALQHFRTEDYYYTLEPPRLGTHMVDEFLFDTRRGFCEHYAASFTTLMRAAGIPARVVTGYQGGELNELGAYYVVRQADAHAWAEVWLDGRGWVRVDPTAAVAPSRIERGLAGALEFGELPSFLRRGEAGWYYWRLRTELARDFVNMVWDKWVIAYGPEIQMEFMARLGVDDWQQMVIVLAVLMAAFMGLVGLTVLRRVRAQDPADQALLLWRRATRQLARAGLPQRPHEGPKDYVARVASRRPDLAAPLRMMLRSYLDARYLRERPEAEHDLKLAVRGFSVERKPPAFRSEA